jgi:hypothetical protein
VRPLLAARDQGTIQWCRRGHESLQLFAFRQADDNMRFLFRATMVVLAAALTSAGQAQQSQSAAVVIVAPFTVDRDSAGVLRALADTCLAHLVQGLKAQRIEVERRPQLSETNLDVARPAHWAVLGHLTRDAEQFQAELRLLDVTSGEELRSYFNADKNPGAITKFGELAAVRIAHVIEEQKGSHQGQ